MKKRIRKKLHKKEFSQYGISIMIPIGKKNVDEQLNSLTKIAENNQVLFIGGGSGYFSMPSEEYGDMDVPSKIISLIDYIAFNNNSPTECIIGYYIKPSERKIDSLLSQKIKLELDAIINDEYKINLNVDLWN